MLAHLANVIAIATPKISPFLMLVASGGDAHGGGHGSGGLSTHLPNLVHWLTVWLHAPWLDLWVNNFFALFIAGVIIVLSRIAYSKREMIPGPFQNGVEMVVEGLYNFIYSILGKEADRYAPFLATLFVYILISNWIGMIPLGHSPSTSLAFTGALALLVFFYVQYTGIRRQGIGGYLFHLAGEPRDTIGWVLLPLFFLLHLVGELVKPVSLALRLFGNITGEDMLIAVFVGMGVTVLPFLADYAGLPLQTPFYFLGLLLSTVQALVFTLLSTIYILLMLPHPEEHAEAH